MQMCLQKGYSCSLCINIFSPNNNRSKNAMRKSQEELLPPLRHLLVYFQLEQWHTIGLIIKPPTCHFHFPLFMFSYKQLNDPKVNVN